MSQQYVPLERQVFSEQVNKKPMTIRCHCDFNETINQAKTWHKDTTELKEFDLIKLICMWCCEFSNYVCFE